MENLPAEIIIEILGYLPSSSCKSARLTSRQFNAVLAKPAFATLRTFINPETAMETLQETLRGLNGRPRALWSPNCSVPADLPLPRSFLHAVYMALGGQSPWQNSRRVAARTRYLLADSSDESSSDESEADSQHGVLCDDDVGMATVMMRRLGRPEVSENMLRQALFRYVLYRSYTYDGEGEAPQLWVMDSKAWTRHQ